jgi:hypothetical protein
MVRESLNPTKSSVRRSDRTGCREHGTISIKHDKRCILVSKPSKRCQRNRSVRADYDEASQAVSHAGKTHLATVSTDSVLKGKVPAIHAYVNSVSVEGYYAMSRGQ